MMQGCLKLKKMFLVEKSEDFRIDWGGIFRFRNRIRVIDIENPRRAIMKKAHTFKYIMHPGSTRCIMT